MLQLFYWRNVKLGRLRWRMRDAVICSMFPYDWLCSISQTSLQGEKLLKLRVVAIHWIISVFVKLILRRVGVRRAELGRKMFSWSDEAKKSVSSVLCGKSLRFVLL